MPGEEFYKEFKKPTKEEWRALLGEMADAEYSASHTVRSPVFIHDDDALKLPPMAEKTVNDWILGGRIHIIDLRRTRRQILQLLKTHTESIVFEVRSTPDFHKLFKGTNITDLELAFQIRSLTSHQMLNIFNLFDEYLQANKISKEGLRVNGYMHPFMTKGRVKPFLHLYHDEMAKLFPQSRLFLIRQETFFSVEKTYAKILQQTERLWYHFDWDPALLDKLTIQLMIRPDIHKAIGSIKGFKLLWLQFMKEHGLPLRYPEITAVPAPPTPDIQFENYFVIATVHALVAAMTGCKRMIVPFTLDGPFSRTLRNIQHMLRYESHINHVVDPIAGSKFHDQLAVNLAQRVWELHDSFIKKNPKYRTSK